MSDIHNIELIANINPMKGGSWCYFDANYDAEILCKRI